MLTAERVHLIRTSGLTDAHFARLWRVTARTINEARRGLTWATHKTPPDTRPRKPMGRFAGSAALHPHPSERRP